MDNASGLDDLLHSAKVRVAGIYEVLHPKTGELLAIFPRVKPHSSLALQNAWEHRAQEMHANQTQIDIASLPEKTGDKPTRPPLAASSRPTFHSLAAEEPAEPPKFEDLPPEVRAKFNGMARGD